MGVAKSWRYTRGVLVLANNHHHHHRYDNRKYNNQCLLWSPADTAAVVVGGGQRRRISWTVVCGVMLFVLGLISFFTGHVASDLEWCSHRLVKRRLWMKKVVNIWLFLETFVLSFCCFYVIISTMLFVSQIFIIIFLFVCCVNELWTMKIYQEKINLFWVLAKILCAISLLEF
jgi:hypothetical protein